MKFGLIADCPVQPGDFDCYESIYGREEAVIMGKATQRKTPTIALDRLIKEFCLDDRRVALFADIMFVSGHAFLMSVSSTLGLTIVHRLKAATGLAILHAIRNTVAVYASEGYTVAAICFDGESGMSKVRDDIQQLSIRLNISAAGQHVPQAENKIRQIKDKARAMAADLTYAVPPQQLFQSSSRQQYVCSTLCLTEQESPTLQPDRSFWGVRSASRPTCECNSETSPMW